MTVAAVPAGTLHEHVPVGRREMRLVDQDAELRADRLLVQAMQSIGSLLTLPVTERWPISPRTLASRLQHRSALRAGPLLEWSG